MKTSSINKEVFRVFETAKDLQKVLGHEALVLLSAFPETKNDGKKIVITIEYAKYQSPKMNKKY